jgi:bifunctional UDP-N-acetylglucosamine pyrophosphorylase/glucosamine-1-phosphate N-acetyltransferase
MESKKIAILILAAGEGTRMKSKTPKVLQPIMGKPMLSYVLKTARDIQPEKIVVVVGHGQDKVVKVLDGGTFTSVVQEEQLGTGHAVLCAADILAQGGNPLVVLYGDNPFIRATTIDKLVNTFLENKAAASILTVEAADPKGYGRVIKSDAGMINKIIEEKDASVEQRKIKEVNAGSYCFDSQKLFKALESLEPNNNQKEIYLTDVIEKFVLAGENVVPVKAEFQWETMGVDSREKLAQANAILRDQINKRLMAEGVMITDPSTTWIDNEAKIGNDTTILPFTFIQGKTEIGQDCKIGPNVIIENSKLGNECSVVFSVIKESKIGNNVQLGPFCSIRKDTQAEDFSKIGTFVEIKKSKVGKKSKVPHLSYIGDAEIGYDVNIGAGSITCNYDGVNKNQTIIEDGAFIGSDTLFVAPVKVGRGAVTGAGSVVKNDIGTDEIVAGVPARHIKRKNVKEKSGSND